LGVRFWGACGLIALTGIAAEQAICQQLHGGAADVKLAARSQCLRVRRALVSMELVRAPLPHGRRFTNPADTTFVE